MGIRVENFIKIDTPIWLIANKTSRINFNIKAKLSVKSDTFSVYDQKWKKKLEALTTSS